MNEERFAAIEAKLDRLSALLDEFEPVLRALVASIPQGPLAWAIKRKTKTK